MKQLIITLFSILAVATTFSCKKIENSSNSNTTAETQIIKAYTCTNSKISFADHGVEGLKLNWEDKDGFSVYDKDGNLAATFTINEGVGTNYASFKLDGTTPLTVGETYTAVFPKSNATTLNLRHKEVLQQEQRGNASLSHLSNVCKLEDSFTVESNDDITISFNHEMAVMSMFFYLPQEYNKSDDGELVALEVTNGDHIETLQLSSTMGISGLISTHLLIEPNSGQREVIFKLLTDQGKCYSWSGQSSKDYVKGYRYNALINNGFGPETTASGYYINPSDSQQGINNILPTQTVWVINDLAEITENNNLKSELAKRPDNSIYIVAPNITALQANALKDCKAIKLLSLPSATSLGNEALGGTTSISNLFLTQKGDWNQVSSTLLNNTNKCVLRLNTTKKGEILNSTTWTPKDNKGNILATISPFNSIILSSEVVIDPNVSVAPFKPLITLVPDAFNVDDLTIPDYDSSYEY